MHYKIIGKLTGVLDQYMHYIDETPPLEQPQRFGNKAYRLWSDRVRDVSKITPPSSGYFETMYSVIHLSHSSLPSPSLPPSLSSTSPLKM